MKKLSSLLLVLLLFACSKEEEVNNLGTISADLDGVTFSSNFANGSIFDENDSDRMGFAIVGTEIVENVIGPTLNLTFSLAPSETLTAKDYQFTDCIQILSPLCGWFLFLDQSQDLTATSLEGGTDGLLNVTITSIDFQSGGSIKGTFSGLISDDHLPTPINLTNGKFDVPIF